MNKFDDQVKDTSRTPLSDSSKTAPSYYIEVNPKKGEEFGSIIIRFDWNLFIDVTAKAYQEKFLQSLSTLQYSTSSSSSPQSGPSFEFDSELLSVSSDETFAKDFEVYSNVESEFKGFLSDWFSSNKLYGDGRELDEVINKLINQSLISLRVSNSTKLGTGTASIVLENFDYQWLFQGTSSTFNDLYSQPIFQEGIYLTIDAKGRFKNDKYYRIFTGSVVGTSITDAPNDRRISIECKDLSKMLSLTRYNTHPAFLESDIFALQGKSTVFSTNLAASNDGKSLHAVEIAKTIIPNIKDSKWINPTDKYHLTAASKEMWQYPTIVLDSVKNSFGTSSISIDNFQFSYSTSEATYDSKKNQYSPQALVWGDVDSDNNTFEVYKKMFNLSKLRFSEFKSRINILDEVSRLVLFSTYIDGSGNIHFHPPRYDYLLDREEDDPDYYPIIPLFEGESSEDNDDLEDQSVFKLLPDESINESYTQSEDDIVTSLWVLGESDFGIFESIQSIKPEEYRVIVVWMDGAKRYGYRERKLSTAAFGNNKDALEFFAVGAWLRTYLERKKMTSSMPMRPELQVDRPIYIPWKKMVYHIISISHSYSAGTERGPGDFTTSITCNAGRSLEESKLLITNLFSSSPGGDTGVSADWLLASLKAKNFNLVIGTYKGAKR